MLLLLPASLQAQLTFITNNGAITITGYIGDPTSVTIPSETNGYPITGIGDAAFQSCIHLANVTIGTNVASIENDAFLSCPLTNLTLPNSVTNIGNGVFNLCADLTNITIPASVISIGTNVFAGCMNLSAITVDTNNPVYRSVAGVLFNINQTMLIEYPGGIVGSYTIPDSVTNIQDGAFGECANLTGVTIGNGVTCIGPGAFFDTGLTNVTIPDNVTSIGDYAFNLCIDLANVTIGNSVTNIGQGAFFECSSLVGAYFRGNAPSIGTGEFSDDNNPTVYYLPGTTGWPAFLSEADVQGAPWFLPNPLILNNGPSFGVQTNRFGFIISWATNLSVVVQASTNLGQPAWTPVSTNSLTNTLPMAGPILATQTGQIIPAASTASARRR